jgi:hypothetical protein
MPEMYTVKFCFPIQFYSYHVLEMSSEIRLEIIDISLMKIINEQTKTKDFRIAWATSGIRTLVISTRFFSRLCEDAGVEGRQGCVLCYGSHLRIPSAVPRR